jgi:hypothetical protein
LQRIRGEGGGINSGPFSKFSQSCFARQSNDMYFGAPGGIGHTPLLSYSDHQERATLVRDLVDSPSMPSRKRGGGKRRRAAGTSKKSRRKPSNRRVKGARGVRVTKGRVAIRLPGHGVTKLAASQLVRYVPLNKLKAAAKKVLRSLGHTSRNKRSRKGRKKTNRRTRR